ncbi:uncharacterized protein [Macrobrachium rosenbergii]|uniref:uncharacterized protein n=1 Tax=Macrobrachium rosenbergii TaxID=79674 RepID=UPI0034D5F3E4
MQEFAKKPTAHRHPLPHGTLTLTTNASSMVMCAVLEQDTDDCCQLLAFFGKKLTSVEQKYSAFDRELLEVHRTIHHFHHMLEGRQFVMQRDHQPLVRSFAKTADAWSAQQQHHLSAIAEHSCTIKHLKVEPLPTSEEYRYLFTIINRSTRWPKAQPIWQQKAESCMKALIGWVSRHGVPYIITSSSWGVNFMSTLWNSLADNLGAKIIHTTAYSPEANGIIKRLHRSLKASLTARFQGGIWRKELPLVLLGLKTSPHTALNISPAEALYGQSLTLPADTFQHTMSPASPSDNRKAFERIMPAKATYHIARKVYIPNELQNAEYAFIWVDAHRIPPHSPDYLGS